MTEILKKIEEIKTEEDKKAVYRMIFKSLDLGEIDYEEYNELIDKINEVKTNK